MKRKSKPWIKVFDDGREVLNLRTQRGVQIYNDRREEMAVRQNMVCKLYGHAPMCPKWLTTGIVTFDHEHGRGMNGSKRDDRIKVNGKIQNAAVHLECNMWKGSRYIDYHWEQKGSK